MQSDDQLDLLGIRDDLPDDPAFRRLEEFDPSKHRDLLPPNAKRLLDANDEISGCGPESDIAYIHSVFALCGLPYRKPPEGTVKYERRNGRASLLVTAGDLFDPDTATWVGQGMPYGPKARVIMAYICAQAVKSQSQVINTAESMCGFMNLLGFKPTGGQRGSIAPFKQQLHSVIAANFTIGYLAEDHARTINASPVDDAAIWFPESREKRPRWEPVIRLDDRFFDNLLKFAVPFDLRAVGALTHNALAMDIYFWLTHRLHRVHNANGELITWTRLHEQFGASYAQLRDFRLKFRARLTQALTVYPQARIEEAPQGLRLYNSPPPVSKRLHLVTSGKPPG